MTQNYTNSEATLVPWWRLGFSGQGWNQVLYTLLALPVNVWALLMVFVGKSAVGFGYQLTIGRDLLYRPLPDQQPSGNVRAFAYSLITLPLNAVTFLFSAYLCSLLVLSVAYPLRAIVRRESLSHILASNYYNAWGGPTLAGAWGVHAVLAAIMFLGPIMWAIGILTWLQGRLLQRLHPASL